MDSGRKQSGFLPSLMMLIEIQLSKFPCPTLSDWTQLWTGFLERNNPLNHQQQGGRRAISGNNVSSVDGNVLGTYIAVIHTAFLFPEVGVESCQRAKLSVCLGLSNKRAVSGSSILFHIENKLLNLSAEKSVGNTSCSIQLGWMKNPDLIETVCLILIMIYFSFQSSKIHILSLLLLLHCLLKLVSIKTAELSPAPGLLLLSNSFFPFQSLTKSAQNCGLVKSVSGCARSHFTYSDWPCDSKKVQ